MKKGIRFVRFG